MKTRDMAPTAVPPSVACPNAGRPSGAYDTFRYDLAGTIRPVSSDGADRRSPSFGHDDPGTRIRPSPKPAFGAFGRFGGARRPACVTTRRTAGRAPSSVGPSSVKWKPRGRFPEWN